MTTTLTYEPCSCCCLPCHQNGFPQITIVGSSGTGTDLYSQPYQVSGNTCTLATLFLTVVWRQSGAPGMTLNIQTPDSTRPWQLLNSTGGMTLANGNTLWKNDYYVPNSNPINNTITGSVEVDFVGTTGGNSLLGAVNNFVELRGVAVASLDAGITRTGTSAGTIATGTIVTTTSRSLIVSDFGTEYQRLQPPTATIVSGGTSYFRTRAMLPDSRGACDSGIYYAQSRATGTYSLSFSNGTTTQWIASIYGFKCTGL